MWELEALLKRYDNNIEFDHLNNQICCYPHIINICLSHIIASSTCISKQYLEALKSKSDGDLVYSNIKDDNDDNNNDDDNGNGNGNSNGGDINDNDAHLFAQETDIPKLTLDEEQLDIFDDEARALYTGLKHDPIKHAHRIVRIVCLSDQRKQAFKNVISTGNNSGWFRSHNNEVIKLPDLELLHDVKTRWDLVYHMIEHLLELRPVSVHMYGPFRPYC